MQLTFFFQVGAFLGVCLPHRDWLPLPGFRAGQKKIKNCKKKFSRPSLFRPPLACVRGHNFFFWKREVLNHIVFQAAKRCSPDGAWRKDCGCAKHTIASPHPHGDGHFVGTPPFFCLMKCIPGGCKRWHFSDNPKPWIFCIFFFAQRG